MNITTLKREAPRLAVDYSARFGIKTFGADNLYPHTIYNLLKSSPTGASCVDRYARFIEGGGFAEPSRILNEFGDTANDILHAVANDFATFGGFALHVSYNAFGVAVAISHIPFEKVRLKECDGRGYTGSVLLHDDWQGIATKSGKKLKVSISECVEYPIFNPLKSVVISQINKAGGLANYHGQVYYCGLHNKAVYPIPKVDRILTELSCDVGLSNIKLRNVRNNFLPSAMVVTKTGQPLPDDGNSYSAGYDVSDGFSEELAIFQGDECTGNLIELTVSDDSEKPDIIPFPSRNYDKDFTVTDESVTERIYSAFEQEPFLSIRKGKLGFSGTVIKDAYSYYNALVASERNTITRAFNAILGESENNVIKPLTVNF